MRNKNWVLGKIYEFTMPNGDKLKLRLKGFNQHMNKEWVNLVTQETINDVPPYTSVRMVG